MMPDYWTSKPLRELVSISKGKKVITSDTCEQNSIPYIGAKAFRGDFTAFTSSTEAVICEQDDVLILWDGERSGLATTGLHGAVSSTVARLRSKGEVNPHFLYYFIDSKFKWIQERRTGLAVPHVPKDLKDLLIIDLPTPTEQQKIASILSSVDDAIQATQAVIYQTHRVKQGLLQHLLTRGIGHTRFKQTEIGEIPEGWEFKKLTDLVNPNRPITYGIVQTRPPVVDGIPCVRVVDLVKQSICIKELITTTPEINHSYKRTVLQKNDIMFALRGEIGHVVIVDSSLIGANLTRGIALISPRDTVLPEYLLWAIRSPIVRNEIFLRVNGSALREIPLGELRQVKVPVPPINEQHKIAEQLSSVDRIFVTEEDYLHELFKIKRALMQDLLAGRVRVKLDGDTAT